MLRSRYLRVKLGAQVRVRERLRKRNSMYQQIISKMIIAPFKSHLTLSLTKKLEDQKDKLKISTPLYKHLKTILSQIFTNQKPQI
tara:strand:+ start:390 stop:644 length:255 start_codon:yes stop_codon:yes gene_type:complete